MERLLLPSIFMHKTTFNRSLFQCRYLIASAVLSLSSISFAAVPLNDSELTNNFLNNLGSAPQIASAQLIQSDSLIQQLEENKLQNVEFIGTINKNNLDPIVEKSLPLVSKSISADSQPKNVISVIEEISALVKAKHISNSISTVDNTDRKTILISNDPLFAFNILNEIALYDTDSDSYRWNGKLSTSYDLSKVNNIYYDNTTGSYEFNNISGIVEFQVELYDDDRGSRFRRANYVF